MAKQRKKIKESWPWSWTWRRPSSGSVFVCVGLGDALQLPEEDHVGAVWVLLEHQRRVQFEGCAAEPLQTIPAILPGFKWSCLLLLSEVTQNLPSTEVEGFFGCYHGTLDGRHKEVADMAKKVMKKLKEEVERKGLKFF